MNVEAAVKTFHATFGHPIEPTPAIPDLEIKALRHALILEELEELLAALEFDDLVGIAQEIADVVYVIVGTAIAYGIPFNRVFAEVHRSNMAKVIDGAHQRDARGKTIKPDGWAPPNIARVLATVGACEHRRHRWIEKDERHINKWVCAECGDPYPHAEAMGAAR